MLYAAASKSVEPPLSEHVKLVVRIHYNIRTGRNKTLQKQKGALKLLRKNIS